MFGADCEALMNTLKFRMFVNIGVVQKKATQKYLFDTESRFFRASANNGGISGFAAKDTCGFMVYYLTK